MRTLAATASALIALVCVNLLTIASPGEWAAALVAPDPLQPDQLLLHYSALPRIVVALLVGAMLGLSGLLLQDALANPIASPTTLGVEAGASLALTLATLAGLLSHPWLVSFAGATLAFAAASAVAGGHAAGPVRLALGGLMVALFCGALGGVLKIFNQEYLSAVFLWSAGSLAQDGWSGARRLFPVLLFGSLAAAAALRPLGALALGGATAEGVGVSTALWRTTAVGTALVLSATTTATVGVIGFVGLAAPHLARLSGARRLSRRMAGAGVAGAALTLGVDQTVQLGGAQIAMAGPTGAVAALLGAPFLVWLALRRPMAGAPAAEASPRRAPRPSRALLRLGATLLLAFAAVFCVRQGPEGWRLATAPLDWARLPAAALAGAMTGAAGFILRRLLGNPLASPEALGVGAGLTAGLIAALMTEAAPTTTLRLVFMTGGAAMVLGGLAALGRRTRFAPETMLLIGVTATLATEALATAFLAFGDPRAGEVLAWMAGSTWGVTATDVALLAAAALLLLPPATLARRWLDMLPLGAEVASGAGVPVGAARVALLILAAGLTAAASLVIGPISFVGLIAPHAAAQLGLVRAGPHFSGSILMGALLMTLAEFIGANIAYPYEAPAGLIAALIGAPYFAALLSFQRSASGSA